MSDSWAVSSARAAILSQVILTSTIERSVNSTLQDQLTSDHIPMIGDSYYDDYKLSLQKLHPQSMKCLNLNIELKNDSNYSKAGQFVSKRRQESCTKRSRHNFTQSLCNKHEKAGYLNLYAVKSTPRLNQAYAADRTYCPAQCYNGIYDVVYDDYFVCKIDNFMTMTLGSWMGDFNKDIYTLLAPFMNPKEVANLLTLPLYRERYSNHPGGAPQLDTHPSVKAFYYRLMSKIYGASSLNTPFNMPFAECGECSVGQNHIIERLGNNGASTVVSGLTQLENLARCLIDLPNSILTESGPHHLRYEIVVNTDIDFQEVSSVFENAFTLSEDDMATLGHAGEGNHARVPLILMERIVTRYPPNIEHQPELPGALEFHRRRTALTQMMLLNKVYYWTRHYQSSVEEGGRLILYHPDELTLTGVSQTTVDRVFEAHVLHPSKPENILFLIQGGWQDGDLLRLIESYYRLRLRRAQFSEQYRTFVHLESQHLTTPRVYLQRYLVALRTIFNRSNRISSFNVSIHQVLRSRGAEGPPSRTFDNVIRTNRLLYDTSNRTAFHNNAIRLKMAAR